MNGAGIGPFSFLPLVRFDGGSVKVQALIDVEHQVKSQPQVTTPAPSSVSLILFFLFFHDHFGPLGEAFPSSALLKFDTLLKSSFVVLRRCPDTTAYNQKTSIGLLELPSP